MKTAEIRRRFLDYFARQNHKVVSSSSLIPANDPTLLFTNAGMVQFKDVFLGLDPRDYQRATTSQRCVRAGGKHNDLENVGYTARHHTFFEMLGNFSFGDYFKRDAICFAWQFLTEELKLPREKLWVSVFEDDDEAAEIWVKDIGVDPNRISRCGAKDNFWAMGDTGPCGPCTEIFYDHGADIPGGPPGSPEADGDRYIEIWNIVFMQYERSATGTLSQLPKPSVDTGMGLERIAAVMQGVHNNYEIDLFQNILAAISKQVGKDKDLMSQRVIADHIRSTVFLITDGVVPSNEGRGYVLRRIMRRAIRHGQKLGLSDPFLHQLVAVLVKEMGDAYPEIRASETQVTQIVLKEEQQFQQTLTQGLTIYQDALQQLSGKMIPGDVIFKLYDTYGFPVDLTADMARESGLTLDLDEFHRLMEMQRQQSRQSSRFQIDYTKKLEIENASEFVGYETLEQTTTVQQIFVDGKAESTLRAGQQAIIVLNVTPFYAESGGQVGDTGTLTKSHTVFEVVDTQKQGDAVLHHGVVQQGEIRVGDELLAKVSASKRQATRLNHSATHLLHAALQRVLGKHVMQKGSLVLPDKLRFDFQHFEAVTDTELQEIELLVNEQIRLNHSVHTELMSTDAAKQSGAQALFGEKYGDKVRVLSMGEFSKELCGGTHVARTGDIGFFKIISETGVAAGVRRIEALTGEAALQWLFGLEGTLAECLKELKAEPKNIIAKLQQLLKQNKELAKQNTQLKATLASKGSDSGANEEGAAAAIKKIGDIEVLIKSLQGLTMRDLRASIDQVKNQLKKGVVVLLSTENDAVHVVAALTKNVIGVIPDATEYVKVICGQGGGRADMAQGGTKQLQDLDAKIKQIYQLIETSHA